MTDTTAELPPKNHNNPPSEVDFLDENLRKRHAQAMKAADGHLDIIAKIPEALTKENEAKYITDLVALMQNLVKEVERRRKQEKDPFLRQGDYVDSFFGDIKKRLQAGIDGASAKLGAYLKQKAKAEQEERDAIAKLLAERAEAAADKLQAPEPDQTKEERNEAVQKVIHTVEAAKVAQSIAAAPVATMTRAQGSIAGAGLVNKWVGTVKDVDQLDLTKLRPYLPPKELQAALDRAVKAGCRQCNGAEIKEVLDVKVK